MSFSGYTQVTCISFMNGNVLVGGWSRCLTVYRDRDDVTPRCWGEGVHNDDILCMTNQEPNILATASYDGDIVIWNTEVERNNLRLNASEKTDR